MPGEKDLHPYQKFCVDFLEEKPQCALFLDCGLGKTIITLTAISHLLYDSYEVSRVLIIAPLRVARDTWIGELSKWEHLKGLRMERILGTPKERVAALSRKAELYVINRENVEWLLLFGAVLAVRQDQLTPLLFRHPRGVKQQLAKVDPMVQGVRHHQPQSLGAFGRQVSRQQIGAIPALFDGLKHAVFRLLADVTVPRQYPGDRRF